MNLSHISAISTLKSAFAQSLLLLSPLRFCSSSRSSSQSAKSGNVLIERDVSQLEIRIHSYMHYGGYLRCNLGGFAWGG